MEIAKGIKNTYYQNLDLSSSANDDWGKAIKFFEKRINERYVQPIDVLITAEKELKATDKKFGFTIMSIDCLLIETLQSFREGVTDSSGQSKELFVRFLRQSSSFSPHFNKKQAEEFYKKVRCNLLHQAQTPMM